MSMADIRQLISELAKNTAHPDESKACYKTLHRIFHEKSLTRSKEAARLMLALGDQDLLRALRRRYSNNSCTGSYDVRGISTKSESKQINGTPVSHIEKSGDVIHTVFSESGMNQATSLKDFQEKSFMGRRKMANSGHGESMVQKKSHKISFQRKQTSRLRNTMLLRENPVTEDEKTNQYSPEEVMIDKDLEDVSAVSNFLARTHSASNITKNADSTKPFGYLSNSSTSTVSGGSLDSDKLGWNNENFVKPSSRPAPDDNSRCHTKRVLQVTGLHHRPRAVHLPDGKIRIPASLPVIPSTTFNRMNSLKYVSKISDKIQKRKNFRKISMMDAMEAPEYELPKNIFEDLHVVKQHRRSFFADGNSLVEVRPRTMPTAPTLIATHTAEGKFHVPIDIESNRRAILAINTIYNALHSH
ncbi:uncharacterized protein LOC121411965 [Lytechinus variegatus]|uniref:uncharacterized protein LOC121411965 n=1 Tax=Lytechinus variegatus TaxID=7654 RepID=UPI001BB25DA8|nr:uncharacterized protein LOC121411965 [Lytechinus variegatus]